MYNKSDLLISLIAVINFLGRCPTEKEMKGKKPGMATYTKYFGSFNSALIEAQKSSMHKIKPTEKPETLSRRDNLIVAIKESAEQLGKAPESKDFRAKGSIPSYRKIVREFGSFSTALRAAGFEVRLSAVETKTEVGQELIFKAIVDLVQKNQRLPNKSDLSNHPILPSSEILETAFGSLEKCFRVAGVLGNNGKPVAKHFRYSMIDKLKALTVLADGDPLAKHADELSRIGLMFCSKTYEREFGSWGSALKKAEILPQK